MIPLRLGFSNFLPDRDPLEDWSTFIATERFLPAGEFEYHSPKIAQTLIDLPIGTLISHLATNEIWIVENQEIDITDEGERTLKVTGRTLESFLENRIWTGAVYGKSSKMKRNYTMGDAILVHIWNAVVNATGTDVVRPTSNAKSVNDVLPNVVVTDSVITAGTSKMRWVKNEDAYSRALEWLEQGKLGIRMIRPDALHSTGKVVTTVASATGNPTKVVGTDTSTKACIDIYEGVNRSRQQSTNGPVIFHYQTGDVEDPKWLFSRQNYKTQGFVISDVGSAAVIRDEDVASGASAAFAGFNKRTYLIDAGTKDSTFTDADFIASFDDLGQADLRKNHPDLKLFDGKISENSKYKYGVDYYLGDRVSLVVDYNYEISTIVTEYTRTHDENGESGYPTLALAT